MVASQRVTAGVTTKPPKFLWQWRTIERGGSIAANTKSEARSILKLMLGVGANGRLPSDVVFSERTNNRP